MADDSESDPTISWFRALLTAVIIVGVGVIAFAYGPNWILTKIHGKTRSSLVALATATFFVLLFVFAFALRWLQRRKII